MQRQLGPGSGPPITSKRTTITASSAARRSSRWRRTVVTSVVLLAGSSLALSTPAFADPSAAPTSAPSSGSISSLQSKSAQIQQQVVALQTQVSNLQNAASVAEENYNQNQIKFTQAQTSEHVALAAEQQAKTAYDQMQQMIDTIAASQYESHGSLGTVTTVMNSGSPQALLDSMAVLQEVNRTQATTVNNAFTLKQQMDTAEASAKSAQDQQATLTAASQQDMVTAQQSLAQAQQSLTASKLSQTQIDTALTTAKMMYVSPQDQTTLNAQYAQIAATNNATPIPPATGAWSAAIGQAAADRAVSFLGTPYSWAGGSASGPTSGSSGVGFDCSGLALYAWAPYLALPHSSEQDYTAAGSMHPAVADLLPGDLVFWSHGGAQSGIHHVAIYVGNGNVVQAPQTGDTVKITPLSAVDSGYFGATRPLT